MLYIIHSKCCHNVHSILAHNYDMKYTHFMKREEHCRAIYLFYPYSYVTKPSYFTLIHVQLRSPRHFSISVADQKNKLTLKQTTQSS